MPAKKAAPQKAQSNDMDMGGVWMWVYGLGVLIAGVLGALAAAGAFTAPVVVWWILWLAAVLAGLFYFVADDFQDFGLRVVVLAFVFKALDGVPAVGPIITGFFGPTGVLGFVSATALALGFMFLWKKRIAPLFGM